MNYEKWDERAMRSQICEVGRRLYELYFIAANDGNISVRLSESEVLITPTGVSKGFMTPASLIKVTLNGTVIGGAQHPSSETPMHLRIYRERPDVRAVVHAHPPVATGLSVAGVPLDRPFLPEIVVRMGPTPVAPYAIPGGEELPDSIAPYIKDHTSILLGNHGAVTYGPTLTEALFRMETLELGARIYLAARLAGQVNSFTDAQIEALRARFG